MTAEVQPLVWSAQFKVGPLGAHHLPGDKILLPPAALEQLLAAAPSITSEFNAPRNSSFDPFNPYSFAAEREARNQSRYEQQKLPHPLTFRLVNPSNNRVVYAGIREFSAGDDQVVLSHFLAQALGLEASAISDAPDSMKREEKGSARFKEKETSTLEAPIITIHAKELLKGTYVKLRPLEAGYDPLDWKSLLEEHLRKNFTTLTRGEMLRIPAGKLVDGEIEDFWFLVDEFKPDMDGICVVDTDLEVDIEALNEDQARETLRRIATKAQRAKDTREGSSIGGQLDLFKIQAGQVATGEYVDYQLSSWDRSQGLEIELKMGSDEEELDLFVSPFSARQRAKPRDDEHLFADFEDRPCKRLRLSPTNVELQNAEAVWISVHAPSLGTPPTSNLKQYSIRTIPFNTEDEKAVPEHDNPCTQKEGEVRCTNCQQPVPQQSLFLHENFCLRNNIICPKGCGLLFQKRSTAYQTHWHCPHDTSYGSNPASHHHHNIVFHTPRPCPSCPLTFPSLPVLAHHRTTTCPSKLILCTFCHLVVSQEGPIDGSPWPSSALFSNLTPHELADGARTTDCHLCNRIVRLRDMATHLKHHDLERASRPAPRLCRNVNCGRTLDGVSKTGDTRAGARMGQGAGNEVGLCSTCFGPLYVSMYDPEGKALKRRVERRYLGQFLTGCGKGWCSNEFCKSGRKNQGIGVATAVTTKEAMPMVKSFVDGLAGLRTPLHFCVDESSQRRRATAEMLAAEPPAPGRTVHALEWCVAALEAESGDLDRAREWMRNFAPAVGEEKR